MSAPYYTGDTVPLKFTVSDADGAVNPEAVNVEILKPDNKTDKTVNATITDNTVSCTVPASVTDLDGGYRAYFVLDLPDSLIRTHKIEFSVKRNPEKGER